MEITNLLKSAERGSEVSIDVDLLNDESNPSFDVINYAINQQKKRIERFDKLEDYYEGNQDILSKKISSFDYNQNDSKDTKVMVNNAKYITDIMVGFTTGNPISIAPGKDKNIQPVLDTFEDMDIDAHNTELEKDLSVFGCAYELLYVHKEDGVSKVKIGKIDPRGIVVVTDDTLDHNPLFAIYYQEKHDLTGASNGYLITIFTKQNIITYRTKVGSILGDSNIAYTSTTKHYFKDVPVVAYRNNEEKQGDFEQAITLIDAYNRLQSDRLTDKNKFVDAILAIYGATLDDSANLKDGVLEFPAGKGQDGVTAEYLTKTLSESDTQVLAKAIEDNIHKTTYVPNLNDENFSGTTSGEAMKYKLIGLLQTLATKQRYLTRGIRRRLQLVQTFLNIKGNQVDCTGANITINPNIPVNMSNIIDNIKNAEGVIPQLIALGWLPGTNDPQELVDMLNKEKEDNISLQQKALASQEPDKIVDDSKGDVSDDNSNDI